MSAFARSVTMLAVVYFLVLSYVIAAHAQTLEEETSYAPMITEISPFVVKNEVPWIELYNPKSQSVDASKITVVINDDFEYALPKRLNKVPGRSFVVLRLDGIGEKQNTYTFQKNITVLHLPLNIKKAFSDRKGQIAVYQTSANGKKILVDFVAWGAPGSGRSLTPERNQIWKKRWFVNPVPSFGDYDKEAGNKTADYIIGRIWGKKGRGISEWTTYSYDEKTPGSPNLVPRITCFTLSDGATVRSEDISVGWTSFHGAKSFIIQLSGNADFRSIIEEKALSQPLFKPSATLDEGTYYYRVKAIDSTGREGDWSITRSLVSKKMKTIKRDGMDGAVEVVLSAMQYRRQRKDTHLLCIDGCASDADASTTKHWDNIHPDAVPISGDHGDMNCVRASISMMNSFYGGSLSQDRIAYFTEEENTGVGNGIPEGDLAHSVGMSYSAADGGEETVALEWALDETATFMDANPSFAQIQAWIDNNQPIMTRKPGHLRAMNGYRVADDATQWVHIMDPWSGERWETYATWNGAAHGTWVGPVSAPNARNDEPGISTDSDGDGIMDFDEQIRFATGRFDKDSDNDAVEDKNDIREYVFNAADAYSKRNADFDGDGVRKEIDPDNDGDTFNDGCEDANYNGKYEPALGETSNFAVDAVAACTEKPVHAVIVFDRSGSMAYPPADPVLKYDRAAESATLFLDTWLANDVPANTKVGLAFYDHNALFDTNIATNTTLELLNDGKRNSVVAAFAANRPNYGSTSIGKGISKSTEAQGFNTAANPVDAQHRMVIVLTDGMENTPPYMDDPAITSALSANKIDGYVLGIGDDTQIDTVKLNNLADILNHTPASFAKDLDAFELEKFFLQTLADTQGMEFSVDPVQKININEVKTHSLRVNDGAKRVSFVVAWNEPNGKLTFTLKNPLGVIVPPDVTKSHNRYQVSTKRNPVPGLWTLTVIASAAATPAPAQITYSIMALEKNPEITSHFAIKSNDRVTGTPLLITADLSKAKKPFTNALVTVELKHPSIGVGTYLSNARVLVPRELPVVEKEAKLNGTDKKRMIMALNKMTVPTVSSTITLNDKGVDGDEIADDGRYSAYFKDTARDGIYTFRLIASDAQTRTKNMYNREKVISIPIHAAIHPQSSEVRIKFRDFRPESKETTLKFVVTPRDRFGNKLGPGRAAQLGFDVKGKIITLNDLSDGSYEVEMIVPGDYRKDILVLPVDRIKKRKVDVQAAV